MDVGQRRRNALFVADITSLLKTWLVACYSLWYKYFIYFSLVALSLFTVGMAEGFLFIKSDPINQVHRAYQTAVFRLRTHHIKQERTPHKECLLPRQWGDRWTWLPSANFYRDVSEVGKRVEKQHTRLHVLIPCIPCWSVTVGPPSGEDWNDCFSRFSGILFFVVPAIHMFSSSYFFFFRIFSHFCVGSMCLMRRLHLARSCASSPDSYISDQSFLMLSNHLRFDLPLLFSPAGTSIPITCSVEGG